MLGLSHFMLLSAALFCIGLYGVMARRNVIAVLMSVELMLNAVNINFVAFARLLGSKAPQIMQGGQGTLLHGQVFTLFVITVAAAETAVALAIVIAIVRMRNTVWADDMNLMKW